MTGWELRIWRKSMLWSREKAAREFGVTQRTWVTGSFKPSGLFPPALQK
ncbi:YgeA [Salmonella enterica subsp. enterica serovar Heidelberg str. N4630]|nr:YgeA [Salmonella enterica subsp. enterica serovar Heidelberg str. N4630]